MGHSFTVQAASGLSYMKLYLDLDRDHGSDLLTGCASLKEWTRLVAERVRAFERGPCLRKEKCDNKSVNLDTRSANDCHSHQENAVENHESCTHGLRDLLSRHRMGTGGETLRVRCLACRSWHLRSCLSPTEW